MSETGAFTKGYGIGFQAGYETAKRETIAEFIKSLYSFCDCYKCCIKANLEIEKWESR